jgi:ribosomal protein L29
MTTLKSKEIVKMSKEEKVKKMKELRIELVKAKSTASKKGSMKIKEIKKIIARINSTNK